MAARERNWLSWVKLSVTLFIISATLALRFSFFAEKLPSYSFHAEEPVCSSPA